MIASVYYEAAFHVQLNGWNNVALMYFHSLSAFVTPPQIANKWEQRLEQEVAGNKE